MPKIDKTQYSKEEWKIIREKRRQEKENKVQEKHSAPLEVDPNGKYYVLCLKHGTKYGSEYVNRLYNMVKRNTTIDFEMVCLTEDSKDINEEITIRPLPPALAGWWCKPYMFSNDLQLNGTVLYLDLDVVIANNIDKLFTYAQGDWCIIRDFTRTMRPGWQKYNSSVIRFEGGTKDHIWTTFAKNKNFYMRKHHGDQDYIYEIDKSAVLFPDSWILSWKWEVRKNREFAPGGTRGSRKLKVIENVIPPADCSICVFHGDPNPDNCDDPWVKQNWT